MHLESPRSGKYPLAALGVTGGIANFHNRDLRWSQIHQHPSCDNTPLYLNTATFEMLKDPGHSGHFKSSTAHIMMGKCYASNLLV